MHDNPVSCIVYLVASGFTQRLSQPRTFKAYVNIQWVLLDLGSYDSWPQHFLYFLPLPQGQGSLRPTLVSFPAFVADTVVDPALSFLTADLFWAPAVLTNAFA